MPPHFFLPSLQQKSIFSLEEREVTAVLAIAVESGLERVSPSDLCLLIAFDIQETLSTPTIIFRRCELNVMTELPLTSTFTVIKMTAALNIMTELPLALVP
ncbi:hypothetical protein J6590_068710 [Homalodisca vitripennis]|nr:hypothetical protein J6590_068710 [Homalodisca vitripennis]